MPDVGSLDLVESGALTAHKAEIMGLAKLRIRNQFRACEVDISEAEVCSIAQRGARGGGLIAEVYSPHRITARSSEFGLRPGFAVDLLEESPAEGRGI